MNSSNSLSRRSAIGAIGLGMAGAVSTLEGAAPVKKVKGNIKQSVCRWCYGSIPLPKLAKMVKEIGYQSVELLSPEEYKVIKPLGLTCAILGGASIADGLNRKENHDKII